MYPLVNLAHNVACNSNISNLVLHLFSLLLFNKKKGIHISHENIHFLTKHGQTFLFKHFFCEKIWSFDYSQFLPWYVEKRRDNCHCSISCAVQDLIGVRIQHFLYRFKSVMAVWGLPFYIGKLYRTIQNVI